MANPHNEFAVAMIKDCKQWADLVRKIVHRSHILLHVGALLYVILLGEGGKEKA